MTDNQATVAADNESSGIEAPPTTIFGILKRLGPGLIVAGSIVGSGELIATTKTGAEAGFWLLWLILIGCVIKVFIQVEFGRYTISSGNTSLTGLNEVPGPAISYQVRGQKTRVNWLIWYWLIMTLASLAQLGGIVGGVGQALQISWPLTEQGKEYNQFIGLQKKIQVSETLITQAEKRGDAEEVKQEQEKIRLAESQLNELGIEYLEIRRRLQTNRHALEDNKENQDFIARLEADENRLTEIKDSMTGIDDKIWATVIAIISAVILVVGRYGFIQSFSTVLVASFTLITIGNLMALQMNPDWAVSGQDILNGLSFQFTPVVEALGKSPIVTALATFGIIGVGASELVSYPYWCQEKGYAKFTGEREETSQWAERANGWLRVMRWDAWCSMVVYTFATIAFYLLGAAILGRAQLNPGGSDLIQTLSVMYEPVFGTIAPTLFLFGAFAVLYSTFFVANASHARVDADGIHIFGLIPDSEAAYQNAVKLLSGFFPLLCLSVYIFFPKPDTLVLISGIMQAIMLPMLSFAALYFRYYRVDSRTMPGIAWDIFLWISSAGMLIAGGYLLVDKGLVIVNKIMLQFS